VVGVVVVALFAAFIDGYAYVYRLFNHIPFNQALKANQVPVFLGRELFLHKGLDLQGGTEIVLQIDPTSLPSGTTLSVAQASTAQIMEKRVNNIGVSEAQVTSQGDSRVVVDLPGVDFNRARDLVGKTAKLTFVTWVKAAPAKDGKIHLKESQVDVKSAPPTELVDQPDGKSVPGTCGGNDCVPDGYAPQLTGIDGSMITNAQSSFDTTTGQPDVSIDLSDTGASLMGVKTTPLAAAQQGTPENQLAIFLDNTLINNANVQGVLNQGTFQITGGTVGSNATYRNDLAATLAAGRLPGHIDIVQANSVGATLGFDSVRKSLIAGGLGLAVVVLFMVLYYRLPGLVASLALAIYALITLAIFKLFPVTMSLPGLAGFVLSVGMAVDANVLIFERLREELRNGRALAAAAEAAQRRAFPAIRDSNISTLITCAVLFGYDRILTFLPPFTLAKGFALTLGIGVIVSFFSAVIVTQLILQIVIRIHSTRTPFLYAVERIQ